MRMGEYGKTLVAQCVDIRPNNWERGLGFCTVVVYSESIEDEGEYYMLTRLQPEFKVVKLTIILSNDQRCQVKLALSSLS